MGGGVVMGAFLVMVIPITVMMPEGFYLVPPLQAHFPAAFPRLVQFMAPMLCLPAVVSVVLNGFVEFVVRIGSAPLAIVIVGGCARRTYEHEHGSQCGSSQ